MKIGLIHRPSTVWPKFDWVAEGLGCEGHEVHHGATMDQLELLDRECDVLLFEHREPGPGRKRIVQYAPHRQATWLSWWFDLFLGNPHVDHLQLFGPLNRCMDAVFVKERGMLDAYKAEGISAHWLDQGCPLGWKACEHRESPEFDVLIFGSRMGEYRQRHRDVQSLADAGFKVAWAGDNGGVPSKVESLSWCQTVELPQLMSRAAVTLHVDLRSDVPGYRSDRFWLATGAGACVLSRKSLETPDVPHVTYERFDEETIGRIRSLVGDRKQRQEIGKAARDAVMAEHTYRNRVREIVQFVEGCRSTAGQAV